MRILLDTHVFLWSVAGHRKLSPSVRSMIVNASEVYVSSASIWEAVIKQQLKKLDVEIELLAEAVAESGFVELPVTAYHAVAVSKLPPIHRDPFDRILIAQAISEPLHLLTCDSTLTQYSELVQLIG